MKFSIESGSDLVKYRVGLLQLECRVIVGAAKGIRRVYRVSLGWDLQRVSGIRSMMYKLRIGRIFEAYTQKTLLIERDSKLEVVERCKLFITNNDKCYRRL